MNKPLVTVIVPCYNYGKYLEEAVDSILKQTYPRINIAIIDDGSTDDSKLIAAELVRQNSNIKYIYQKNNGIVSVRNKALDIARGEYIIQLDADDTLPKNYIEEVVNTALKHRADVVYTDYKKFGEEDSLSNFPEFSYEMLKNRNFIHAASLVRLKAVGDARFDSELTKKSHEDWDFFLSLAVSGAVFKKSSRTHLNYRIHNGARNNLYNSLAEKAKYAETYMYVIDKYKTTHAEEYEYLSGRLFSDWFKFAYDQSVEYRDYITKLEADIRSVQANHKVVEAENKRLTGDLTYEKSKPLYRKIISHFKK